MASNRFYQDDKLLRLHDYKPTDLGLPSYLDAFCAAQSDCMLPAVTSAATRAISQGAASGDTTTNLQGTVNVTQVRGATRCALASMRGWRSASAGSAATRRASFVHQRVHPAGQRYVAAHPEQSRAEPGRLHAGHPVNVPGDDPGRRATFATTSSRPTRRTRGASRNLTVNLGLRFEWENGISEDDDAMLVDFDPNAKLAISDLAEAAYAQAPIPQVPPADFHVRGGSVYATDPGQDGTSWRPQAMWMPRVSAVYRLGDKTVLKAGYGLYYDTLNAGDFGPNNLGFSATTTNTNSTDFGRTFLLGNPYDGSVGISDPFPVRADGTRFDQPIGTRWASTRSSARATRSRTRTTSTRASSGGG